MIKLELLSLAQAAKRFPMPPSPQTLWRWRTRGVNGVRLACVKCGKRWYTTDAAIETFLAEQTVAATRSNGSANVDQDRTEATVTRLRQAGLLNDEEQLS